MSKKQDSYDKDVFRQVGQDLLRKVREAEQEDSRIALSSWQKVEDRLGAPQRFSISRMLYIVSSVAATVGLLFAVGCYFWMTEHEEPSLPLALLNENKADVLPEDEIILVKNGSWVQLEDEATVVYDEIGKSKMKEEQAKKESLEIKTDKTDQIIVPKGRRASIVFSDGTKMYVNADTRVIYPSVFAKDKREILVDGEAYLEVAPDPSRPFYVKTNRFEVKVLGTRFNVCAYRNEPQTSVVLVEGKVEVQTDKNEKSILAPNQMMELRSGETKIREVDVLEYICWKDNLMMVNDRKAGEVFSKLARYYGRTILFDNDVNEIPLSGKLDLRASLEEVVEIICQSLFLKQETDKNNNIVISK